MTATLISFRKATDPEKELCIWETKMLSAILLRWWKSLPLSGFPKKGK